MAEVYEALDAIETFGGYPTILLLCTSQYPTPPEDVNLNKLKTLSRAYPDLIIGFSDHTQGVLASSVALGLGAVVFEKHFTLDNNLFGPDHWFSENPEGLRMWVNSIRTVHKMLGKSTIKPTRMELINKKEFQRMIVASKDLKKGDMFDDNCFTMRRILSERGLSPKFMNMLIGHKASRDFKKGEPICL